MSEQGLAAARAKMEEAGVSAPAIEVFTRFYELLESGATGIIREDSIEPLLDPPMLADVNITDAEARDAIQKTVIIKLNGGLGTSMGLDKAKTLLQVRDGKNFLDLIVAQVLAARERIEAQEAAEAERRAIAARAAAEARARWKRNPEPQEVARGPF